MKFIINTITSWDEPPRARHQIAYSLSEIYPVLFVSANKKGFPKIEKLHIKNNLSVLIPHFPIDFRIRYRLPLLNEIYQRWLFSKLKRQYPDYNIVNFDYTATQVFDYFRNVVFYCNDDFFGISRRYNPFPVSQYLIRCLETVIKKSTFCIGISELLVNKLKGRNTNSYLIKLGAPNPLMISVKPTMHPRNDPSRIQCGLVGFISSRNTSLEILNSLLDEEKIYLTIVGPVDIAFKSKLRNIEKVNLKGTLTGELLYNEIDKFDVAIAPYNVKDMNEGGTPNKLWQYLTMGKPVVITELVAIREWVFKEKLVYVSGKDSDFTSLVLKSNEENNPDLITERIAFSAENSWDKRMHEFLSHYEPTEQD